MLCLRHKKSLFVITTWLYFIFFTFSALLLKNLGKLARKKIENSKNGKNVICRKKRNFDNRSEQYTLAFGITKLPRTFRPNTNSVHCLVLEKLRQNMNGICIEIYNGRLLCNL